MLELQEEAQVEAQDGASASAAACRAQAGKGKGKGRHKNKKDKTRLAAAPAPGADGQDEPADEPADRSVQAVQGEDLLLTMHIWSVSALGLGPRRLGCVAAEGAGPGGEFLRMPAAVVLCGGTECLRSE